jgi:hypothetical protein
MAFDDLALLLPSQCVEDRTQLPPPLAEDGFPASFGDEHNVVLSQQSSNVLFSKVEMSS